MKLVSLTCSTSVEVKLTVGQFGTSRKWLRRCSSRSSLWVWMLFAWIVSWALDFRRVVAVQVRAAVVVVELPAHLGHQRLPGDETDPGVGFVEDVVAGQLAELGCGCHA